MYGKIAVNDPIVGVAPDATADGALWAYNLLAFARDQHFTGFLLHAVSVDHQTEWQLSGLVVRCGDLLS
jgi:hypothetical protein